LKEDYKNTILELSRKVDEAKSFVRETLRKEIDELKKEKENLAKERVLLQKKIMNAKKEVREQFDRNVETLENFVKEKLAREIEEFVEDKKKLKEQYENLKRKMYEKEKKLKEDHFRRISTLEKFVVENLEKELKEFQRDKKLLERRRVELEAHAARKLHETRKMFIAKAASAVDRVVSEHVENELRQLKEDLKVARENNFGRKIFEAFAHEYMASYLSEGSKVKELTKNLEEMNRKLAEAYNSLKEKEKKSNILEHKLQKLEESLKREKTINRLIAPLSVKQKKIMRNLLEEVETSRLEEAFSRYLDTVLQETSDKDEKITSKALFENSFDERKNLITGDKETSLLEGNETNDSNIIEVITLKKLAGIN
jgi:myosin heavy subunit